MTVCIAAICTAENGGSMIVGASDRMMTAADVQFEPNQMKLYKLTANVVAMLAGDMSPQVSICTATERELTNVPNLTVEDVALAYAEQHALYRKREGEQIFLKPIGLTAETLTLQGRDSDFVKEQVLNMQNFDIGEMQTIIAGSDDSGGHLYQVNKWGGFRCDDGAAFTCAGIGEWHASSHLMLSKYSRSITFPTALLQVYYAKRKAQVAAPGVGESTDIFFIDNSGVNTLNPDIQDLVTSVLDEMESKMRPVAREAEEDFAERLAAHLAKKNPAKPPTEAPPTSEDGEWAAETWTGPSGDTGPNAG